MLPLVGYYRNRFGFGQAECEGRPVWSMVKLAWPTSGSQRKYAAASGALQRTMGLMNNHSIFYIFAYSGTSFC